jgi:hypothetical protein
METFLLTIPSEQGDLAAEVALLRHDDHTQYTVTPAAPGDKEQFGTQVFHLFPGKPLQAAFPGTNKESRAFWNAAAKALGKHLERQPDYREH